MCRALRWDRPVCPLIARRLTSLGMTAATTAALNECIDRIRAAAHERMPLRLRGGGSKDFYGDAHEYARGAGPQAQVLDTRILRGISSYEPSELVITALAGTPLTELEAALAEHGQCLPFEPPHFDLNHNGISTATVGGMVAAGLSGPARATVGAVRDYVLGAKVINGRGQLLTFGGQVMKNVAGYDVSRLLVGSLGTLGLITEVSLKVLPIAPAQATLRFALDEAQALERCNRWAGQPLPLNASAWLVEEGQATLYLRLRGAAAAVQAAQARLLAELPGQAMDADASAAFWQQARDLRLPWFAQGLAQGQDLWRLSVPGVSAPLGVGDTLIDWLGAQRWVWAAPGDAQAAQRLRSAAQAVGGHASLFVPALVSKPSEAIPRSGRFAALAPQVLAVHQRLKAEFDPAGIFNPGRLHAAL